MTHEKDLTIMLPLCENCAGHYALISWNIQCALLYLSRLSPGHTGQPIYDTNTFQLNCVAFVLTFGK